MCQSENCLSLHLYVNKITLKSSVLGVPKNIADRKTTCLDYESLSKSYLSSDFGDLATQTDDIINYDRKETTDETTAVTEQTSASRILPKGFQQISSTNKLIVCPISSEKCRKKKEICLYILFRFVLNEP
ncbi:hypothetical protein AVEN_192085-1 [Araneus ventricosus]|uniref:Uncharacterized protein n=1 Tax=Araneus ventricosus TaxID=182803 RepID=A0A4Y2B6B5_ARAVE|nr:hypothetical protein AVEN_192085-1 [Araneus ventricosus]